MQNLEIGWAGAILLGIVGPAKGETLVMMNRDFWDIPWLTTTEKVRLHILYLCCIRFIVEKYGGTMEMDPEIRVACIRVPQNEKAACFEELQELKLVSQTCCEHRWEDMWGLC